MKKYMMILLLALLFGIVFLYREKIIVFYVNNFIEIDKTVVMSEKNNYARDKNFSFVQLTENFKPQSKQDLYNIYYTVINSGNEKFSFYCPDDDDDDNDNGNDSDTEYTDCMADVKDIANDQTTLSHINNFVHPYNGFKHIETEYDSLNKITIYVKKTYSKDKIGEINKKVKEIYDEVIEDTMTDEDKIKAVHDYIINNSKYDSERSDKKIVKYDSDTAYGNLIQGYGLCGGYTDSMAIFLNLFGINNYKVSSENHVWNALELDGKWYHLDLTWDDPITTNQTDILEYNFFLIKTSELKDIENTQHNFPNSIYQELK